MKRLYLVAAVAGLWPVAQLQAQEGLAPTAPVVPAPVLQNGKVLAPSAENGWGAPGGPRLLAASKWSPFRNPATASAVEPIAPAYAQPLQPLPPLPNGVSAVSAPEANCGPAGCGKSARDRSCWARIKAFLCYHDSPTGLPKCQPTPYVGPLQGMFPCSSVAGGCAPAGCNGGYGSALDPYPYRYGVPSDRQPPPYAPEAPPVMPQPQPLPTSNMTTAGAVVMPPRGMQGSPVQPTWQGRVVPESAVSVKPAVGPVKSQPGTIVPTGYLRPAPK